MKLNLPYDTKWYVDVLNSMTELVLVKGNRSKLLWANKAFLDYYGMTEEQLIDIVDAPHSDPDDTLQYVKDDHFVFTSGKVLTIEEPITRHDGKVLYFATTKTPVFESGSNERVKYTVGVSRPLADQSRIDTLSSERTDSKQNLSELKALIRALPNATLMMDASKRVIAFSDEWIAKFGDYEGGITDRYFEELYEGKFAPIILGINRISLVETQTIRNVAYQIKGRKVVVNIRIKPWFFPNGDFGGTIVMMDDVTDLKINEEKLAESYAAIEQSRRQVQLLNQELEEKVIQRTSDLSEALHNLQKAQAVLIEQEKFASLGRMAGGIAHEINNPLAIIDARARILTKISEKRALTAEEIADAAALITSTVARITKIINGLRTVSRTSTSFTKDLECIKEVIDEAVSLCGEKMILTGIRVEVDIKVPEHGRQIYIERVQFAQVLLNLIGNAIDAISDLATSDKWIRIEAGLRGGFHFIKVSDCGHGIPAEIAQKMFEPFFTSKEIGKGTGLGLSISKSIIEKHEGNLYVEPSSTHTCFVIEIPTKEYQLKHMGS